MAAQLIAAGLRPLKGLKPEVLLQFHVAGVLVPELTRPQPLEPGSGSDSHSQAVHAL